MKADGGFTLAELLVAAALTLLIVSTALSLVVEQTTMAKAPPAAADRQQRARLALSIVTDDLRRAGAGLDSGAFSGPLGLRLPPVMPRRTGLVGAEGRAVARSDAVSLMWTARPASATTTASPMAGSPVVVAVTTPRTCPAALAACGIVAGMTVLVFDDTGRFAVYLVSDVVGSTLNLQVLGAMPPSFETGAAVVPVNLATYYLDAANHQLRVYDGHLSDAPVADDVVAMAVDYFGEPSPPVHPRPAPGVSNCLFDAEGAPVSGLPSIPAADGSLAPLPLDIFRDGPWCGEGDWTFDADLMRIRGIRVTIRVQASLDQLRLMGADYMLGGSGSSPVTAVADLSLGGFVVPPNLNAGR
jgi:hypothetical protein